jgi:hypothetical protein
MVRYPQSIPNYGISHDLPRINATLLSIPTQTDMSSVSKGKRSTNLEMVWLSQYTKNLASNQTT